MVDLENLRERFNLDEKFCRYNHMSVSRLEEGAAEAVMTVTPDAMNSHGIVQGGAIFALADLAFAAASHSYGGKVVGTSSNIQFLRPGVCGALRAVASEVNRGRRTCLFNVKVYDEQERLIADAAFNGFHVEEEDEREE